IRVTNENIMKLIEMVDSGMPVIVTPGRKDMAVNLEEGYEIPSISTIPGKPAPKLSKAAEKEALANREKKQSQNDSIVAAVPDTISGKKIEVKEDTVSRQEPIISQPDSLKVKD
ncbi:MAG: L,D-transpeptidase, partial [Muribaculaceae bacterium]|nr:L,D-transpeptidase [Muribaculaceae bacterium]